MIEEMKRCAVALIHKNLLKNPFASSRSSLTCTYKCGNACRDDAPNEFSSNEYFADVAKRAYSRRQALKVGGAATVAFGGASGKAYPAIPRAALTARLLPR